MFMGLATGHAYYLTDDAKDSGRLVKYAALNHRAGKVNHMFFQICLVTAEDHAWPE